MTGRETTVLVVDDDPFTAELSAMVLEMSGFATLIAEGGVDALQTMSRNVSVDVIVSDMNMPFIDGVQLHAELRRQGYAQPFVLLTGDEAAPLRRAHPQIDAVVTKDENLQETLPEVVGDLLARSAKQGDAST